jgi:hypothetical protein
MSNKPNLVRWDQYSDRREKHGNLVTTQVPTEKTFTDPNGNTGKYKEARQAYNYGTREKPCVDDLYFEGCPVWAGRMKIETKTSKKKEKDADGVEHTVDSVYTKGQIKFVFDNRDPKNRTCIQALSDMHVDMGYSAGPYFKEHFGIRKPEPEAWMEELLRDPNEGDSLFPRILYYQRSGPAGNKTYLDGAAPHMYVELSGNETRGCQFIDMVNSTSKTITMTDGSIKTSWDYVYIQWRDLVDKEFLIVPTIQFKHLYSKSDGKFSSRRAIVSALVLQIRDSANSARVEDSMNEYANAFKESLEAQRAQQEAQRAQQGPEPKYPMSEQAPQGSTSDMGSTESVEPAPLGDLASMAASGSVNSVALPAIIEQTPEPVQDIPMMQAPQVPSPVVMPSFPHTVDTTPMPSANISPPITPAPRMVQSVPQMVQSVPQMVQSVPGVPSIQGHQVMAAPPTVSIPQTPEPVYAQPPSVPAQPVYAQPPSVPAQPVYAQPPSVPAQPVYAQPPSVPVPAQIPIQ